MLKSFGIIKPKIPKPKATSIPKPSLSAKTALKIKLMDMLKKSKFKMAKV